MHTNHNDEIITEPDSEIEEAEFNFEKEETETNGGNSIYKDYTFDDLDDDPLEREASEEEEQSENEDSDLLKDQQREDEDGESSSDQQSEAENENMQGRQRLRPIVQDLHVPLYAGCGISIMQAVLLVLRIFVFQKLSKKSIDTLLAMSQLLLPYPNRMPKTMYNYKAISPQGMYNYFCFFLEPCFHILYSIIDTNRYNSTCIALYFLVSVTDNL